MSKAKVTVVQTTSATLMSVRPAATSIRRPPRGPGAYPKAPGPWASRPSSDLGGEDDADHLGEQRHAFDERRRDDHGGADVAASRRLPRGAFHGRRAHFADAESGAEQREPDAEACSQVPERELVHVTPPCFFRCLAARAAGRGGLSRGMDPRPPLAQPACCALPFQWACCVIPMNTAESMVKTYAWTSATKSSSM